MFLSELQTKDIISVKDGRKVGRIIDVKINDTGNIESLIIETHNNLRNLFKSSEETKIPFTSIEKIGSDVILVNV